MLKLKERRAVVLLALAIAAAGLIHVSIALSQIALGFGIVLCIVFRHKLAFPRIWMPLGLFCAWTVLTVLVSPDPWGGRAIIRKLFVFLFIPLLYCTLKYSFSSVYWLMATWAGCATASAGLGFIQFVRKYLHSKASGEDFYVAYVGQRITGFESHWMTFGGLQLSVLSLLVAQVLFSNRRMPAWAYLSIPIILTAIILGGTRSIWIAMLPAVVYLIWSWRPMMILLLPVIAGAVLAVAPSITQERVRSLIEPRGDIDSNRHRIVTFRTGLEMIKAHPWFGLGPEQISRQFDSYVPTDISRPLPAGYYGHLHNIYLQFAAERGVPGLLLLLAVIGMCLWDWLVAIKALGQVPSQELFVVHGSVAVVIGILVGGLFEYNLGDSEVLMMFSSVVATGYAAIEGTFTAQQRGAAPTVAAAKP